LIKTRQRNNQFWGSEINTEALLIFLPKSATRFKDMPVPDFKMHLATTISNHILVKTPDIKQQSYYYSNVIFNSIIDNTQIFYVLKWRTKNAQRH
jgi:hypothetical protein